MSNQLLEKNGGQDMPTCDLASVVSQPLRANHPPISELLRITNLWENVKNFGQPVYLGSRGFRVTHYWQPNPTFNIIYK